jgi:hypothetical protein
VRTKGSVEDVSNSECKSCMYYVFILESWNDPLLCERILMLLGNILLFIIFEDFEQ